MTAIQSPIDFKCKNPQIILENANVSPAKQILRERNLMESNKNILKKPKKSIMGYRRSPRKRLGLGENFQEEDFSTNEDVLDAIFKLSPHSPIKRTRQPTPQSSLATTGNNKDSLIKSPTRQLLSPIRALSLNSPPNKGNSAAVQKADLKRAQILQNKLNGLLGETTNQLDQTPTKQTAEGRKLNLECDETPIKSISISRRITRSAKKKAISHCFDDEDDYKENIDPQLPIPLKKSPKKKARIIKKSLTATDPDILKPENIIVQSPTSLVPKTVHFGNALNKSNIPKLTVETPQRSKSKKHSKLNKENSEAFQKTKHAFHTSAPEELIGREKEIAEISSHIKKAVSKSTSGSLYISGAPGTGKTACLNQILLSKEVTGKSIIININCMKCQSGAGIYAKIASELGGTKKDCRNGRSSMKFVEDQLTSTGPTVILLLDEMDQLDSRNQEVLYTMFEWPALADSRVMLIGIANSLDLTDRILPRLQMRVDRKPALINFAPYTREQIVSIIEQRLKEASNNDKSKQVIDPAAVQFCARKVAAVAGDARKALDICRRAVEVVESNIATQDVISEDKLPTPKKVNLPQIANILNNVYESSISTSNGDDENALPLQQKLAICTLILLTRSVKCKVVTLGKFHEAYAKVCKKRQVTAVSQSEFLSLLQLTEARGILLIKRTKQVRQTRINLALQEKDVEFALQDKAMLTDVLSQGLPS